MTAFETGPRTSVLTLILPIALAFAAPAAAEQSRLTSRRGTVDVHRRGDPDGSWHTATIDLVLLPGDFVRTGPDGVATLTAADGSVYTVNPDTMLQLGDRPGPLPPSPGASPAPEPSPRPPGVSAERWLALGPDAGIALVGPTSPSGSTIEGTLYARRGDTWIRIFLTSPPSRPRQVVPAR